MTLLVYIDIALFFNGGHFPDYTEQGITSATYFFVQRKNNYDTYLHEIVVEQQKSIMCLWPRNMDK